MEYDETHFIVGVPNAFVAEYLEKNWRSPIENTLLGIMHKEIKISFRIAWSHHAEVKVKPEETSKFTLVDYPGPILLSKMTEVEKLRGCLMDLVRISDPDVRCFVKVVGTKWGLKFND